MTISSNDYLREVRNSVTFASKPSKSKAEELLVELCEYANSCDNPYNARLIIAQLMKYFEPTQTKNHKVTVWGWLSLALPKKDVRQSLMYIYSDGKSLTASDGHRLHRVYCPIPEGFYDKHGNLLFQAQYTVDQQGHPGNPIHFDRVIPSEAREADKIRNEENFSSHIIDNGTHTVCIAPKMYVNKKYWDDASLPGHWAISVEDSRSIRLDLMVEGYVAKAVIMGIRV